MRDLEPDGHAILAAATLSAAFLLFALAPGLGLPQPADLTTSGRGGFDRGLGGR
jgi:hypothetical protein